MQFENLINEFNLNDVYGYKEKQEEKDRKNKKKTVGSKRSRVGTNRR